MLTVIHGMKAVKHAHVLEILQDAVTYVNKE